jgi:hypothetical protein
LGRKVLHEGRNVLEAVTQGRYGEWHHSQAKVEAFAKAGLGDFLLERLICRGDDTRVDLDGS